MYNNYEGFDFPVSGPYQEYPVLSDTQAYDGGSPGADRVIFKHQRCFRWYNNTHGRIWRRLRWL